MQARIKSFTVMNLTIATDAAPCPYTHAGCSPLSVTAGAAEPAAGPLFVVGSGPKRRIRSTNAASTFLKSRSAILRSVGHSCPLRLLPVLL